MGWSVYRTTTKQHFSRYIDSEALAGDYKTNPFHFENANCESMKLPTGTKLYPINYIETDFEKKQAIVAYRHLFDNLCIHNGNFGNQIDYQRFMNGMTLYSFHLTTDLCSHSHAHEQAYGNVSQSNLGRHCQIT